MPYRSPPTPRSVGIHNLKRNGTTGLSVPEERNGLTPAHVEMMNQLVISPMMTDEELASICHITPRQAREMRRSPMFMQALDHHRQSLGGAVAHSVGLKAAAIAEAALDTLAEEVPGNSALSLKVLPHLPAMLQLLTPRQQAATQQAAPTVSINITAQDMKVAEEVLIEQSIADDNS